MAGAELTNLTGLTVQALLIHPATSSYLYCQFKGNIKQEFKAVKQTDAVLLVNSVVASVIWSSIVFHST